MRIHRSVFVLGTSVAIAAIVACSSGGTELPSGGNESDNSSTVPPARNTAPASKPTDNTCLGKAGLAFDDVDCNQCMSDDAACCTKTIACFKDDKDCSALHTCMLACEPKVGGGGGGP